MIRTAEICHKKVPPCTKIMNKGSVLDVEQLTCLRSQTILCVGGTDQGVLNFVVILTVDVFSRDGNAAMDDIVDEPDLP